MKLVEEAARQAVKAQGNEWNELEPEDKAYFIAVMWEGYSVFLAALAEEK